MWVKGSSSNASEILKKLAELATKLAELHTKAKATNALRYTKMMKEMERRKAAQYRQPDESEEPRADRFPR